MAKEYFEIEFNFPVQPEGIWTSFTARVEEESSSVGTFKVSHFRSAVRHHQFPVTSILLQRSPEGWIEQGQVKETLMSALIGHAIANKHGPKR